MSPPDISSHPVERRAALSVIVPVWRTPAEELFNLEAVRAWPGVADLWVADAENRPDVAACLSARKIGYVPGNRPSRGAQQNAGAAAARGNVLLFHHHDSRLERAHVEALRRAMETRPKVVGGAYYRRFDERHPWLRPAEPIERWHNRTFGALYGDQSLFVRRAVFVALGGFAPLPLMEDVEFSRRLRRAGPLVLLDPPMSTSPRRHLERGPWRVTLLNAWLQLLFRAGVSAERLHRRYYPPSAGHGREASPAAASHAPLQS